MNKDQSAYRNIMKATSLFGGVQVFQIIIQVIRSKFVAILLGPEGMGIAGLLTSTTGLVGGLTNFGLGTSAVKDIATAAGTGNQDRIAKVTIVFRRLVWFTGSLGAILTLVLSSWLSRITFGNHDYTFAFVWISISLLFNQLATGQMVLLQGMRKLQHLAKANLAGSTIGLMVTVPLYYFMGIDGIVPGIILTSFFAFMVARYFSAKIKIENTKVDREETISVGKNMLSMGFMISLSGLLSLGASYLVRIYVRTWGGVDQVGLFNAGFIIINTYVGLIFDAMATDYYPRLSAVAHSNQLCRQTINQQAEVSILILAPILIVFLIFIKWIILILYSTKFTAINLMIYWATLGIAFKAASWSIAFILLAKGTSRLYFWNELIAKIYTTGLNLLGYHLMGLTGLGISFMVGFIFYLIQVFLLGKMKFEFSFSTEFIRIFIIQYLLILVGFAVVKFVPAPFSYLVGAPLIIISFLYSYKELDKRIEIKALLIKLSDRFKKRQTGG